MKFPRGVGPDCDPYMLYHASRSASDFVLYLSKAMDETKQDLKYILDRAGGQIRAESDLIGQRTTALCISQSFLVTAFVSLSGSSSDKPQFPTLRTHLIFVLPLVGLTLCAILGASIVAAGSVVKQQKQFRERIKNELQSRLERGGLDKRTDILAHVTWDDWQNTAGRAVALIPWALAVFWVYCLWDVVHG